MPAGRAVGAVRGHGFDDVGHAEDPALGRMASPARCSGSPSRHPLVVLRTMFGDRPGEIDALEDVVADLGVGPDEADLDVRSTARACSGSPPGV